MFVSCCNRQLCALLWRNITLKFRSPVGLLLELALPAFFVGMLILIRKAIGDTTIFPEKIPLNEGVPVLPYRDFANYTAFKLSNVNVDCAREIDGKGGRKARAKFAANASDYCQFLKFAVLPATPDQPELESAIDSFLNYAESELPAGRGQLLRMKDKSALMDYISQKDYGVAGIAPPLGVALIFNRGAPHWDYTVRVNYTFETGERPGRNVPSTKVTTNELLRQAPLCYDFALGLAGGDLDIGFYGELLRDAGIGGGGGESNSTVGSDDASGNVGADILQSTTELTTAVTDAAMPGVASACSEERRAYLFQYWSSGFLNVQRMVDEFIITQGMDPASAAHQAIKSRSIHLQTFPSPRFEDDGFWATVGSTFVIFMMISMLYPISCIIKVRPPPSNLRRALSLPPNLRRRLAPVYTLYTMKEASDEIIAPPSALIITNYHHLFCFIFLPCNFFSPPITSPFAFVPCSRSSGRRKPASRRA
jgi:hypothetical protein